MICSLVAGVIFGVRRTGKNQDYKRYIEMKPDHIHDTENLRRKAYTLLKGKTN